ncbi:ABC transporter permease [Streptomyces olivaceiscleroticus]|uniref:ABC transporter permease n=2 Tax=Streptomyces olivaceiscleroticus TaxID=68245 RepID=A0ABN0ZYY5_9ACTN
MRESSEAPMAVIVPPEKTAVAQAPRRTARRSRRRPLVLNVLALVAGLLLWAVVAALGLVENLPTPLAVARKAGDMLTDGTLATDTLASLRRVFLGYALGVILAVPVGFLMGWYVTVRALIEPYVQFFRTIPPLALIPLTVVLLGIGEVPKVAVIGLASFMACVVASFQGVIDVDRTLINAARVLGASDRIIFAKVVVPAATPFILVGMRIGLGASWATVVAAELIGAQEGLGYRMQKASTWFEMDTIFVSLITIGVLGLLMDRLLLLAERRLTGWQERR